jgi:hypothetical protein
MTSFSRQRRQIALPAPLIVTPAKGRAAGRLRLQLSLGSRGRERNCAHLGPSVPYSAFCYSQPVIASVSPLGERNLYRNLRGRPGLLPKARAFFPIRFATNRGVVRAIHGTVKLRVAALC